MKIKLPTGIEMFYEEHGSGEPLILVHGTGCDHQIWDLQIEAWAKHFRVLAIDARGSGQSTIPSDPETYTVEVMADDVAAFIDALELGRAHISGHSLGGFIALQMGIRHPDKVLSLQVHNAAGRMDTFMKNTMQIMRYPLLHGDKPFCLKVNLTLAMSHDYLNTREPACAREMVTKCLVKNPYMNADAGLLGHLNADLHHDAWDGLPSIEAPVLVTAGELDAMVPKRYSIEMMPHLKNAQYYEFSGVSHFTFWERPEEFAQVTLDFLNGVSKK
jgi:pimeloyl-ACP methyl ester carboxylesterase